MTVWSAANWVVSLATGAAALVTALAGPAFDRPELAGPGAVAAAIGCAVVIFVRRMQEKHSPRP
ncbi:MAG: hypothetical protein H7840_10450 [Alphaproteobacteria bacterium]